jgi:hypothetical protein
VFEVVRHHAQEVQIAGIDIQGIEGVSRNWGIESVEKRGRKNWK